MALDPQKHRLHVFENTGIKVDVDDPIFALVALPEAVLEEEDELPTQTQSQSQS